MPDKRVALVCRLWTSKDDKTGERTGIGNGLGMIKEIGVAKGKPRGRESVGEKAGWFLSNVPANEHGRKHDQEIPIIATPEAGGERACEF